MSDLYEYQAIDGSSKGPIALVLLLQARNQGRLSNQALVKKLPDGAWRPLSSYIPPMTVWTRIETGRRKERRIVAGEFLFPIGHGRSIGAG